MKEKMQAKIQQGTDGRARIWLDGVELRSLVGFDVSSSAQQSTRLTVTLLVQSINQDDIETTQQDAAKPGE